MDTATGKRVFTPPPTLSTFMRDDSFVRIVIGPLGSGKSTAMIYELLARSCRQEPDDAGIRPTKFVIVRNTMDQIKQTCLADIQEQLGPLVNYKITEKAVHFDFMLPDGTRVKSTWLLIPLDNTEDQRRLLSLQLTGAWVSELREIDYTIIAPLLGRLGRFPSKARVQCTWSGLIAETNPWSEGSLWHKEAYVKRPKGWSFYKQPGAFEPGAENLENLPDDYYERLMPGQTKEWIKVHIHGKWGDDLSGQAVYKHAFTMQHHVFNNIRLVPGYPLILGADWGRTPALLIGQQDQMGRLRLVKEFTGENMGVRSFMTKIVMPVLTTTYRKFPMFLIGDPAGIAKSQLGEESIFDVIEELGIQALPASTNDIAPRLRAVESALMRYIDGYYGLLIDQQGCPLLVQALAHEYKYRRKKTGDIEDSPSKTHPWSDLADGLGYMCLGVDADITAEFIRAGSIMSTIKNVPAPPGRGVDLTAVVHRYDFTV